MAQSQRDDRLDADWLRLRELSINGDPEQALKLAEQLVAEAADPCRVAQAHIARLVLLYNTRSRDVVPPLLQQVEEQVQAVAHPRLVGEYHNVAATLAHDRGSYGMALHHVVSAERALERMDEHGRAALDAWHDLAAIYSRLGYHDRALRAEARAQSLGAELDEGRVIDTTSIAAIHAAVYLDQRGDTAACVRQLTDVVERSRPHLDGLTLVDLVNLGYAVRRLAALDHPIAVPVPAADDVGPLLSQINTLGAVCDAVAERRPERALALLDSATTPLDVLGAGEPIRLRSLALAQCGDLAGAVAAERAILLISHQEERELRSMLADSDNARIDQDQLRKAAERHARAALTDPLTGLPNRRKLEDFTVTLMAKGEAGTIGMLDLDGFKVINDTHGHPTGDIVLQRVAGVLARHVGPGDLLARPGGDEFVIVLPGSTISNGETLGERIEAGIRNEDWSTLVPDTPVAVSTGWAGLDGDAEAAYRAADAALYETKRRHHARSAS